jgi:ATP-dependent RNA helicase RhlE
MSFDHLGLAPELLAAVRSEGYTTPTPVQDQAIPLVLAGRDVLAGAQTGTGKTAAFVLPILQRLGTTPLPPDRRRGNRPPVRVLVLTPTRELALQVEEGVRTYGARTRIRSVAIYGGVGFEPQARALRAGPDIVVATPGRLLDHHRQRTIDLSVVEVLVLDEADRMLDMGFIRDIRTILAILPATRQNLLFSATFSDEIRRLADGLLNTPATVQVTPRNTPTELVRQLVIPVDRERKRELLSTLVRSGRVDQALVFMRTKHGASRLADQLLRDGIAAAPIHGNRSQAQRVRALADFKAGRTAVLVATDLAARGIDIDALPHVINFELPMAAEDYVHRIGRTGRAGIDGDAISFVCVDERGLLREIEWVLRRPIPTEIVPGFEPDPTIRPEAIGRRVDRARPIPGRAVPRRGQAHRPGQAHSNRTGHAPSSRSGQVQRPGQAHSNRPGQVQRPAPGIGAGVGIGRRPVALPGERLSSASSGLRPAQ